MIQARAGTAAPRRQHPGAAGCGDAREVAELGNGCKMAFDNSLSAHTRTCRLLPGLPDRAFPCRATLYPGDYAWIEVIDQGGDVFQVEIGGGS